MANMHIISDLFLEYNEFSDSEEIIPSKADLVIFNGNIGKHIKRGFLYIEKLCKLYPDVQFVVNLGSSELFSNYDKHVDEIPTGLELRRDNSPTWPKNLHYSRDSMIIKLRDGTEVDVLCRYGYPYIYACNGRWEDTIWHRNHCKAIVYGKDEIKHFKPDATSDVLHGAIPVFATMQDINDLHEKEYLYVKKWEIQNTVIKILVTHINPYIDSRCRNLKVSPYNIHLERGYWIASDTYVDNIKFLGAKLYSNPGTGALARNRLFNI